MKNCEHEIIIGYAWKTTHNHIICNMSSNLMSLLYNNLMDKAHFSTETTRKNNDVKQSVKTTTKNILHGVCDVIFYEL